MIKKEFTIVLIFCAFLVILQVKGQEKIDSLRYYSEKGDYEKAINFGNKIKKTYELKNDTNNLDYTTSLFDLAVLYMERGAYHKAEDLLLQSLAIEKKLRGENNPDYATSLDYLAQLYCLQGAYKKAEPLYLQCLKITKKALGENHPDYATSLNNLAALYYNQGAYQKAEPLYLQSLGITRKVLGENHPTYAISLKSLASLYYKQGAYQKAEPLYLQLLEIEKKTLGENHPNYAQTLNNLAINYVVQGAYKKAEPLFLQSSEIKKKTLGENHPDYAISLNNLAGFYDSQNDYQKAEPLYLQSLEITKKMLGENHPNYAAPLLGLALLYLKQGAYEKAEPLYLQSLEIRKKTLGENHQDYAISLDNLALFYVHQGAYEKAEKLYQQSLEVRKKILGENHPEYAISLNYLALLYFKQGAYEKAEPLYLQSLEIRKKTLGENHQEYATSLDNLAQLYFKQGAYQKAESLFLQALEIRKKSLGENHQDYAISLNNLAFLYQNQKIYEKAEPLFLQSLAIKKKVSGESDPVKLTYLQNLSSLYVEKGDFQKASIYFQDTFALFQNKIKRASSYLSENELRFFRMKYFDERFYPLSLLNSCPTQYENINIGCYENELLVKNLSLRNQQRLATSIQKSGNNELKNKYEKFISNKKLIVKWNELPVDKRPVDYEQINSETEILEKDLVRQSALFADSKKAFLITWKQIQDKLKPNEVAIDLVVFKYYNKKQTDSIMYSAFVVSKVCKFPKFIPLFEEKELDSLLKRNNNSIDKQYKDNAISDLFLKPLEKELAGITTIYLSSAGLGHQIDFSALPVSETQTFGEKYKLHILSSPAELVDYKVATLDKKSNLELLLYGGIDYDKSETINNLNTQPVENNSNSEFVALATRSGISKWDYLAGTQKEVGQINDKSQQTGFASTIINGRLATEGSIKKLDGKTNPYVLHLATHGFFFPDSKQELQEEKLQFSSEMNKAKIYKTSDDPMMRSGLLFAGANKYWNKTNENIATEDGILTASEISNLDLSACQLVVLSACETGLGEVKGSEGVFGLQRAFKMAGVKNIIMSLWKVPDAQTAELFDIFYSECFAGKSIHEAFQSAQSKMKAKYSPYYWAGFVLLE